MGNKRGVEFKKNNLSMVCILHENSYIKQKMSNLRNHFHKNEYYVEFDIREIYKEGKLNISLGNNSKTIDSKQGRVVLLFSGPQDFVLTISSKDSICSIDNVRVYSQLQQGFLYDENNNPLNCLDGIRSLNTKLSL